MGKTMSFLKTTTNMEIGQIATAKVPAEQARQATQTAQVVQEQSAPVVPVVSTTKYPMVEELTFRAYVSTEAEAHELLKSVQAIVNAVGGGTIIQVVRAIEKNPKMLQQAMTYLPLIMNK